MNPRAQALARTLISRMRQLEQSTAVPAERDEHEDSECRRKLVQKVLFTEVGLTDFAKAQLVAVAMPRVGRGQEMADRDVRELVEFLDAHLDWSALEA